LIVTREGSLQEGQRALGAINSGKILFCVPVLLLGGTEMQMLSVVRAVKDAGYAVEVCCYYDYDPEVVRLFKAHGVAVSLLNQKKIDGLVRLAMALWPFFYARTDSIVHVQYLAPALFPIIIARLAGVRTLIATSHIAGTYAYNGKHKAMLKLAARFCSAFICVSKGVEAFWFGDSEVWNPSRINVRRKHFTIYNAVDVDKISEIGDRRKDPGLVRKKVIGIVGRLAEQKGHKVLLEAMTEVIKEVPDAILLVIGEGPDREKLERIAKIGGLEDKVCFLGAKSQEDVFRLYGTMDVFAMPSLYEGFGLTAAEAMAASLPVVGTQIIGLSEVTVDGETGYLVPPGNAQALTVKLITLLKDPEKRARMGQAGYEWVKANFSMEMFSESMLSVYEHFGAKGRK
jgi:glycosyltransferase involved in cell wall biosynthesis